MSRRFAMAFGGLAALALAVTVNAVEAARGAAPPTSEFELRLAVPERDGVRHIVLTDPRSHFFVVLTNRSTLPQRIWSESWYPGRAALTIEMSTPDGRHSVMHAKQSAALANAPLALTIEPGDSYVFEVAPAGDVWEGALLPAHGQSLQVSMQAVYAVSADSETKRRAVFSGKVVAPPRLCTIDNRM